MSNLSPDAQSVKDAVLATYADWALERPSTVAALRALAIRIKGADAIRQDVLDIADELDKTSQQS
jgi:hypothetical protein